MKNTIALIAILLIAFSLRFYDIGKFPSNLTWDEAALGYNAFSILKTGRDEHSQILPIFFKSFGDYKPGLYVYPTVLSVALFGLTNISVRLPSVLAGVFAVWGLYLFINELASLYKFGSGRLSKIGLNLGLAPALALALQPWHIFFSRTAWEVNLYTTLVIFCLYFLIRSRRQSSSYAYSWIFFSLGFITYQAAKLLSPLLFIFAHLIFLGSFRQSLDKLKKTNKLLVLISLGLVCYVYLITFTTSVGNRLSTQSLIGYRPGISQEQIFTDRGLPWISQIVHSQLELTSRLFIGRFLYHFSPELLFYEGSLFTQRGHIPKLGNLNLIEAFLIPLGIYYLIKNSKSKKPLLIIVTLLVLSAIPASLTLAEFSTFRSLPMSLGFAILTGFGLLYLLDFRIGSFLLFLYLFNVTYSMDIFLVHRSPLIELEYNFGYKEAMEVINKYSPNKIVFTDVYGQPYIYYLFYSRYDPAKFQSYKSYVDQGIDVGRVDKFDKIEFHQFSASEMVTQPNTAFVGTVGNLPKDHIDDYKNLKEFRIIKPSNGEETLRIAITK